MRHSIIRKSLVSLAVIGALGLSACGGGSGSGSGSATTSGNLSSGVITGFGSVFVNGVEYDTSGASIMVNGIPANESDLAVGMVVNLRGTANANGTTGSALSIDYRDDLEGIVQQNNFTASSTLTVMGLTVRVDSTTVFESTLPAVTGFDSIQVGNIVEISGNRLDNNTIQATRVEVKKASQNGDEIEVKGTISMLTATTFKIGTLTVDYSAAASLPGIALSDGLFVEVKSIQGIDSVSGNLIASGIKLESNGKSGIEGNDGEEVELSGPIGTNPSSTGFSLNGTPVLITTDTTFKHGTVSGIAEGVQVEVEGALNNNGELLADKISFHEATETEAQATINAVDSTAGTLTLMGLTVKVNTSTLFKDNGSNPVRFFGLDDLVAGVDRVELSFYKDDVTGDLVAVKLKREDGSSDQLNGTVESLGSGTITVAGVSVDISALSTSPLLGDKVEIKGSYDSTGGQLIATSLKIDN